MIDRHIRDQLKFAKEGAENLAKRNGYQWTAWLKGSQGKCTAAFDREGERWSLSFYWTPNNPLEALAKNIERMDHCMVISQKEFGALKAGELARRVTEQGMMH